MRPRFCESCSLIRRNGKVFIVEGGGELVEPEFTITLSPESLVPVIDGLPLGNWDPSYLPLILMQSVCIDGEFPDFKFVPVFDDGKPGLAGLVHQDMKEYKEASSETIRRFNCKMYKKTKKWVPGHRYDSEKGTYFYLGSFKSHKPDPDCGRFLGDNGPEVHLVVESLEEGEECVSQVVKGRFPDIKVLYKLPLTVDSGEALVPDLGDDGLEPYKDYILERFRDHRILDLCSGALEKGAKRVLENDIRDELLKTTVLYWDIQVEDPESLIQVYLRNISDLNTQREFYYKDLYEAFGVSLEALAKDVLKIWGNEKYLEDFDHYLWAYPYYYKNHSNTVRLNQRTEKTIKEPLPRQSLSQNFKGDLVQVLAETLREGIRNNGIGLTEFYERNAGTKAEPKPYYQARITLSDICAHDLPESLKTEITRQRFHELIIEVDKEGSIT